MKRVLVFIFMMLCPGVLFGVQKCVNFGELGPGFVEYNAAWGDVDWSLVWSHITIHGIATCVETNGKIGDVAAHVKYDDTFYCSKELGGVSSNDNQYCWCKMISPAVSLWVAYGDIGDAEACVERCAMACADSVFMEPNFRSAMLGSLGG